MKKRNLFGLGAVALASFALLTGFGPGGRGGFDPERRAEMQERRMARILDELEVTAEQRTQLEALHRRLVESRERMRREREPLHELLVQEGEVDAARVHAAIDERFERARAAAHERADILLEMRKVLTPEQRKELAGLLQDRHERMKERHEKRWR